MSSRNARQTMPGAKKPSSGSPVGLILALAIGLPLLLVCLIGGVAVLIVYWVANVTVQIPQPPPLEVAQNVNPNPNLPNDGNLIPNIPPAPPAPIGRPDKPMVDLVPLLDPGRDAVHGRWAVADNVLHCNDAHFVPRIQIPYQPPEEYDFIVTFSQPGLRNGISLIMPNPNGGSFFWYLGSDSGSSYGFASKPNKSGRFAGLIAPNLCYTTTVEVRRDGVRGLLNGKELVSYRTNCRDLTCDNWRELRDRTLLGVACDDPTVFHYVRLVEITGNGKRTR